MKKTKLILFAFLVCVLICAGIIWGINYSKELERNKYAVSFDSEAEMLDVIRGAWVTKIGKSTFYISLSSTDSIEWEETNEEIPDWQRERKKRNITSLDYKRGRIYLEGAVNGYYDIINYNSLICLRKNPGAKSEENYVLFLKKTNS